MTAPEPEAPKYKVTVIGKGSRWPIPLAMLVMAGIGFGIGGRAYRHGEIQAGVHGLADSPIDMAVTPRTTRETLPASARANGIDPSLHDAMIDMQIRNAGVNRETAEKTVEVIETLSRLCSDYSQVFASCRMDSHGASIDFVGDRHSAHLETDQGKVLVAAQVRGLMHIGPRYQQQSIFWPTPAPGR